MKHPMYHPRSNSSGKKPPGRPRAGGGSGHLPRLRQPRYGASPSPQAIRRAKRRQQIAFAVIGFLSFYVCFFSWQALDALTGLSANLPRISLETQSAQAATPPDVFTPGPRARIHVPDDMTASDTAEPLAAVIDESVTPPLTEETGEVETSEPGLMRRLMFWQHPQSSPLELWVAQHGVQHWVNRTLPSPPVGWVAPLRYRSPEPGGQKPLLATQKLLPLVPDAEDAVLRQRLEALFASYPSHFVPHIYVFDPWDRSYVSINGYDDVAAASVIKLPLLISYLKAVDERQTGLDTPLLFQEYLRAGGAGELQYKNSGGVLAAREVLRNMIQISDNTCTNLIIHALGGADAVDRHWQAIGLKKSLIRNWLPDLEGTNKISMYEMVTLLYNVDRGWYLSPAMREEALSILFGTHNRRLLVAPLPQGTLVAHKTGDIGSALGDAGLVVMPEWSINAGDTATTRGDYLLSIQVDRPYNDYTARDMIQQASALIYNHVLAKRQGYALARQQ